MSSTGTRPIRGLTYANVSGYNKYPPMASDTDGYRNFLTDIGVGWTYNSWDLRAIPANTLLSQLYPMMTDPEEYFYLEYKGSPKLTEALLELGYEFDKDLPRKSSSYILSSSFLTIGQNKLEEETRVRLNSTAAALVAWVSEVVRRVESRCTPKDENGYPTQGLNETTDGGLIVLKETIASALNELHDIRLSTERLTAIYQEAVQESEGFFDIGFSDSDWNWLRTYNFISEEDDLSPVVDRITGMLMDHLSDAALAYGEASTTRTKQTEAYRLFLQEAGLAMLLTDEAEDDLIKSYNSDVVRRAETVKQKMPEDFYEKIKDSEAGNSLIQYLKNVITALTSYIDNVLKIYKKYGSGGSAKVTSVVIRFYPAAAVVAEPLYGVSTVPLSEHSFLQVATPQNNIAVQFMSCAALDTPDTQWRQLYAEIFKTIMRYGNPKCSVCAGRYIVKDCHLASVPDLSNAFNTAGTFNFGLISENWDSGKNDVVNYIG